MTIQYKFKQSFLLLAVLLFLYTGQVLSASLSLTPAPGVHVNHSTVQLGVYYNAQGAENHAAQFEIVFPSELEPGIPSQGYALLGHSSKAFNVYSSRTSAYKLKIVIVPERMTSTSFYPLSTGVLVHLPFTVKPMDAGTKKDVHVYFTGYPYPVVSNADGNAGSSISLAGSQSVTIASYLTCNDLSGFEFYAADARYADGKSIAELGLSSLQTTAMRDLNKDGVCDQSAIAGGLDSDEDGLSDADEIAHDFLNPYDPSDAALDYDGDGLTNLYEITTNSPPETHNLLDSDGDVMSDIFEIEFGLNPDNASDKFTDADNDGLSNYLEYTNDSIPNVKDTDSDGMDDGFEHTYGFPFIAVATDGASNGVVCAAPESTAYNGTGPMDDKDCDGLTNQQEHDLAANPLLTDTDKDNMADLAEYNAGRSVTLNEPALMVIIQGLLL